MIEKILLDWLNAKLDVPVYPEMPENPPREYVLFERTSGSRSDWIDDCMVAIQSYSDTLLHACELNEKVKDAMDGIAELDEVVSAHLSSDYNFTDTAKKRYRYQAVYDITYYRG